MVAVAGALLFQPIIKFFAFSRLKVFMILVLFSFCMGFVLFYLPVRNALFHSVIRAAWRDVDTHDIIRMRYFAKPAEEFNLTCGVNTLQNVSVGADNVLDSSKLINHNMSVKQTEIMLSRGLGRYLPTLNLEQKVSTLRLYLIVARVLEDREIPFFLTAGSLLGLVRHGGFIPWDDDLDVGIDVKYMAIALKALNCITGTKLTQDNTFHWKLRYEEGWFPFVDLFMYAKDDRYVWALTHYITNTFIYLRHNVFPLTKVKFEGVVRVPVPGKVFNVVNRIYDFQECKAYRGHIKVNRTRTTEFPDGYSRSNVPCKILKEFYKMNHIDG